MPGFVVAHETFTGPLDLLLHLISRDEMEITNVSLRSVTDDFLSYLDDHEHMPEYELADFLVIASRLLYLKSRAILPAVFAPEEEQEIDLATQLKMYKAFVQASEKIQEQISKQQFSFGRDQIVVEHEQGFYPPEQVHTADLQGAFTRVVERLKPFFSFPEETLQRITSIKETITSIRRFFTSRKQSTFREVVRGAQTKSEVVMHFLALLELVKQHELSVAQSGTFDDIELRRI